MKMVAQTISRYIPLAVGLGILIVVIPLVPWPKVLPYLARLDAATYATLITASAVYYAGRAARYWLILRLLGEKASYPKVALACLVAQPVAVLPGGELYRTTMLRRYSGVALEKSLPGVFAQSLAENVGLLLIALVGTVVLGRFGAVIAAITIAMMGLWAVVYWHNSRTSHHLVNKLPWVQLRHSQVRSFLGKNRLLLSGVNFLMLVGTAFISTAAGVLIVHTAAHGVGVQLSWLQAAIAYAVPVILEAVSFLPGGFGVSEQGSVAVLALYHISLPAAVAITLMMRLFTLGMGFVFGFGAMAVARLAKVERLD